MTDFWAKLSEPFHPDDLDWRVQGKPSTNNMVRVLPYLTARAVMDRLDSAVGPENWSDGYTAGPDGGVLCTLSIRHEDEWIGKQDAAENTDIEPVKGGISGAFKRAAVRWGIGRYLHRVEGFRVHIEEGWANGRGVDVSTKEKGYYEHVGYAPFPTLPAWALPNGWEPKSDSHERRSDHGRAFDAAMHAIGQAAHNAGLDPRDPLEPARQKRIVCIVLGRVEPLAKVRADPKLAVEVVERLRAMNLLDLYKKSERSRAESRTGQGRG